MPGRELTLFPQPQELRVGAGWVVLAAGETVRCSIVLEEDASDMERTAAGVVQEAVRRNTGGYPPVSKAVPLDGSLPIWIGESARHFWPDQTFAFAAGAKTSGLDAASGEAYALEATPDGVALCGVGGAGTFYAAQTVAGLITRHGNEVVLPVASVRDWPQLSQRGLYIEAKWGQDLMGLEDWKSVIDQMASLKLNLLGVGIYGCWRMQYDLRPTEFLLVPLRRFPDLQTPKTLRYFSARRNAWQSLAYLPTMFTQDFFGGVVAYGRSRNVTVRPHFNSLGHNTLIPRLYPEVAAKDAHGQPKGYGFCLSNPRTRQMMQEILSEVVERYLTPHGVDDFHLGLDEVWPITGLYAHHPQQVVEPWCECGECSREDRTQIFVNYVLELVGFLKARGMRNVTIWHDQLERMGALSQFAGLLEQRGLKEMVVLNWWRYAATPFTSIRPELGLRRRVTPLGGYWLWSPYRNYLVNIETMCRMGVEQGAEGVEAYSLYDEAYDSHHRLIADYGWNAAAVGSLPEWKEKYARYVFGEKWQQGLQALQDLEEVSALGSTLLGFVQKLDAYGYTYVAPDRAYPRPYPQEALAALLADSQGRERLAACEEVAGRSRRSLAELAASRIPRCDLAEQMEAEAWRVEGLVRVFGKLLEAREAHEVAKTAGGSQASRDAVAECHGHLATALDLHHRVTLACERAKAGYLLPVVLRNWSTMLPFLTETLAAVNTCLSGGPMPELDWTGANRG